jgi:hypothetical protein
MQNSPLDNGKDGGAVGKKSGFVRQQMAMNSEGKRAVAPGFIRQASIINLDKSAPPAFLSDKGKSGSFSAGFKVAKFAAVDFHGEFQLGRLKSLSCFALLRFVDGPGSRARLVVPFFWGVSIKSSVFQSAGVGDIRIHADPIGFSLDARLPRSLTSPRSKMSQKPPMEKRGSNPTPAEPSTLNLQPSTQKTPCKKRLQRKNHGYQRRDSGQSKRQRGLHQRNPLSFAPGKSGLIHKHIAEHTVVERPSTETLSPKPYTIHRNTKP